MGGIFSTIVICLALAAAVFFAARHIIKQRKAGGCGCGCADCPSKGRCGAKEYKG